MRHEELAPFSMRGLDRITFNRYLLKSSKPIVPVAFYVVASEQSWLAEPGPQELASPDAVFSATILASIFRRAARIISSLLFFRSACLSSLFELQPSFFLSVSALDSLVTLLCRLYRVIKSGCLGRSGCFACCAPVLVDGLDPGGGAGWKVMGGFARHKS